MNIHHTLLKHIKNGDHQKVHNSLNKLSIKNLYLENSDLSDKEITALAKALPGTTVEYLQLNNNNISAEGVRAITDILPNSHITELHLHSNPIGDDGIKLLAAILKSTKIYSLGLANIGMTEKGLISLAAGITKHAPLKNLIISSNQISSLAARVLGDALKTIKCKKITLIKCQLGDDGVDYITQGIAQSGVKAELLYFDENNISDTGTQRIAENFQRTFAPQYLSLENNHISKAGASQLTTALITNRKHVSSTMTFSDSTKSPCDKLYLEGQTPMDPVNEPPVQKRRRLSI